MQTRADELLREGFGREPRDTAPPVAAALFRDPDHRRCIDLFAGSVAAGDFIPVELVPEDYERMAVLVEKYADLPLGKSDASVITLAERLNVTEVATSTCDTLRSSTHATYKR